MRLALKILITCFSFTFCLGASAPYIKSFNFFKAKKTRPCFKYPIYCQIKNNKPSIKDEEAFELAQHIKKASSKYQVSARLLTAILRQESAYNVSAKNCNYTNNRCLDFGMGQINIKTIKAHNFELNKLTSDTKYSIFAAAKVLSEFKRFAKYESDWWTRYNASSWDKREIYKHYVSQFL